MTSIFETNLPESKLPIASLERSLSAQYTTNSYKLYWFLGLLDIIKDFPDTSSLEISFLDVVHRMIALSWYTLLEYKLNFGAMDQLGKAVYLIHERTNLEKGSTFSEILSELRIIKDTEIEKLIQDFEKYVPYRYLSPFLKGLTGIPDHKRNRAIAEASRNNPDAPYMIIENSKLIINMEWFEYFYINRSILKGWAELKLTSFLQSRNPNVPAIHQKLTAPIKRNLTEARKYWKSYILENSTEDIFTNAFLDSDELSIDHFIPWSFVLHDKLWNLVPTVRSINSSKGNRLPPWDKFFPRFVDTQYSALTWHMKKKRSRKMLEDYLIIHPGILNTDISYDSFRNILEENIQPAWRIAANQGFGIWEV